MSPASPAPRVEGRHPDGILEPTRALSFVCPLCKGPLDVTTEAYVCGACDRTYEHHAGIPDFRVFPDPYLDWEEDRDRTDVVLEGLKLHDDLQSLLEYYWSFSDVTPPPLREKFVRNAMLGEQRARRELAALLGDTFEQPIGGSHVLELGSGTGNTLFVAAEHFDSVVGTDIGMRWLHLSRRRFEEQGRAVPPLVCCCAEHLPFADHSFDLTWMSSTYEFLRSRRDALAESARVLRPSGAMYVKTVNRFSLARNPYVYLWALGFLPHAWQVAWVRWRRDASYENVHLDSLGQLRRKARACFERVEVALADIDEQSLEQMAPMIRTQVRIYRVLKSLPGVAALLRWFGPEWDVKLSRPRSAAPGDGSS